MKTELKTLIANAQETVTSCSVDEARTNVNNNDYVFIDVREKEELEQDGLIPGSIHIPRGTLEFLLDKSSPHYNHLFDSNKKFIFYCKSGVRSLLSAQLAMEMGLTNVFSMAGGIVAWNK
jgi:rhodanese-related sulfurtransferase